MVATSKWDMKHKDEWAALLWERCQLPPVETYLQEKQPYFGWEDLHNWQSAGHSVGFHTHTHPYCSQVETGDIKNELLIPAQHLKSTLKIDQLYLSYPFGDRLAPVAEKEIFQTGLFKAFFGIRGFRPKHSPARSLERAAVETGPVAWPVFAAHVRNVMARVV
jgi:peptidoglycan/xylan/chitin deacetylase (PgdA/CDA1 family)